MAGAEIEFLLIAGPVGDVALAIHARDGAPRRDHREAVVMMRLIGLEEAGRDPDAEVVGKTLHRDHRGVRRGRLRGREQPFVLDVAEIFALEQDRKSTRLNSSQYCASSKQTSDRTQKQQEEYKNK